MSEQNEALRKAVQALEDIYGMFVPLKGRVLYGGQTDTLDYVRERSRKALEEVRAFIDAAQPVEAAQEYDTELEQRWPNALTPPPAVPTKLVERESAEMYVDGYINGHEAGVLWAQLEFREALEVCHSALVSIREAGGASTSAEIVAERLLLVPSPLAASGGKEQG